jgi:hypothetical protein
MSSFSGKSRDAKNTQAARQIAACSTYFGIGLTITQSRRRHVFNVFAASNQFVNLRQTFCRGATMVFLQMTHLEPRKTRVKLLQLDAYGTGFRAS